jgi:isocitrate dehydrogenase
VETWDISLAGRIIAAFPERLNDLQKIPDYLAELGHLTKRRDANIIKLPNISASNPQLQAAIEELKTKGYDLPDYPEEPANESERDIKQRYDLIKGSAVNPVLREGNSDRRAALAVKQYAHKHPHRMGVWSTDSKSHVAHMQGGDFYASEKSITLAAGDQLSIVHTDDSGSSQTLLSGIDVEAGEVVDTAFMSVEALRRFYDEQLQEAKKQDVLWSLHLKATMMKVSDPILFGHAVKAYYADAIEKHREELESLRVDFNNGIGDAYEKLDLLPDHLSKQIKQDLDACLNSGPQLAMVNSDRGITNLHVPSDIIVDASMPAAIRDSGKMWNPAGDLQDMKAVIPDRCYASIYAETIEDCRQHGAFDPSTMGSVPNVGLMAQKAEEYGSHGTTFEISAKGKVTVLDSSGAVLIEHDVEQGDIWRLCRVKDEAVQDWVKLAVQRARISGWPLVFWLDENRAHDASLIAKLEQYLPQHDLEGVEYQIMPPAQATRHSLKRIRAGENTISVTGNVLRDYLTDLFPIMELGTSAKMLSIVPLINGGGLFETGAGGSAPKHVQQFEKEGHLRWDSLGEFLALGASLEHLANTFDNSRAQILADTLNAAIAEFLEENKSPSRVVNELDNRGSHFYLALYWAKAAAAQEDDTLLREVFTEIAARLLKNEEKIVSELLDAQGPAQDIDGYYYPDPERAEHAMRPSATFNDILAMVSQSASE